MNDSLLNESEELSEVPQSLVLSSLIVNNCINGLRGKWKAIKFVDDIKLNRFANNFRRQK